MTPKTIHELRGQIGGTLADFLTGEQIEIESGSYEENINGDGKLTLTWKSNSGGGLRAGETLTVGELTYYLQEHYAPTANGDGTYTWSPTLVSTDNKLKGLPVYKTVNLINGSGQSSPEKIYTFPYTGTAGSIVADFNSLMANGGSITLGDGLADRGISLTFDQDSIVSACGKIADALGVNYTIEEGNICIGVHEALAPREHYDRFIILGGTRNMAKRVLGGDDAYAAVTMRLKLPDEYPDSVLPQGCPASGHMTKFLIFDGIYPKMELTIGSVRPRVRYLFDNDGNQIYVNDNQGNRVPKTYTEYYITLQLNGQPYNLDVGTVIQGRTLGIVFHDGVLAAREFDLAYYYEEDPALEGEEDDVPDSYHTEQGYWQPLHGEYRICNVADGDTLLPNGTLAPSVGDRVTLSGVALDGAYETAARQELLQAGLAAAGVYGSGQTPEFEVAANSETIVQDFLTETEAAPLVGSSYSGRRAARRSSSGLGEQQGNYIVTSVSTDLITGAQSVHFGTFEPKGLSASLANLLETASLRGSGAFVGSGSGDDLIRHTGAMSLDQFRTLYDIVGHLGMKTVNTRIDSVSGLLDGLRNTLNSVQEQSDRQFHIWFGTGAPRPLLSDPTAAANYPSSEWLTLEEKELHVQDVYYDMTRPAGGTGGRAWRWLSETDENEDVIYGWDEIDDGDTLASLEQLADLSRDNVLTPSEKLVVRREWAAVLEEYPGLVARALEAELNSIDYSRAMYNLWLLLMNIAPSALDSEYIEALGEYDDAVSEGEAPTAATVAYLLDYYDDWFTDDSEGSQASIATPVLLANSGNSQIDGTAYKTRWNAYHTEKTALMTALSGKSIAQLSNMADDDVLTDIEKLAVIREYEHVREETRELLEQASVAGLDNDEGSVQYLYRSSYSALYAYLDDMSSSSTILTSPLTQAENPAMLYDGETTDAAAGFSGATFKSRWSNYYAAASNLRSAIRNAGVKVFVTTHPNTPAPPYKVGDLWIYTDANGNRFLKMCVNSKGASGQYAASDWAESKVYSDPRSALAAYAQMLYKAGELDNGAVTVTLTVSPSGANAAILAELYTYLGACSFTVNKGTNAPTGTANKWSMVCVPVRIVIPNSQTQQNPTGDVLSGGCVIYMYNGSAWEIIQESTSGLLENMGSIINAIVFGSYQGATEGAGLLVGQRFAQLFATAQIWDPTLNNNQGGTVSLAQALFGLDIRQDNSGNYYSVAGLSADKINFAGKTIAMTADDTLTFSGGSITFNADTTLNFNAATINLNADKINWKKDNNQGGFSGNVIPDPSDPTDATKSKFFVDQNGDVTMNNLKANNAELKGKLVTSSGKIELDSVQRTGYVWSGLATPANVYGLGYNDAVCFGIRDYGNDDYAARLNLIGYGDVKGAITLHVGQDGTSATAVSKLRMGPNTTTDRVVLDGVDGSVEADKVKVNKNILLNTGKIVSTSQSLSVTDADTQMVICTSSGDQTITLSSTPPNGTIIIIKKTTNSGYVEVKNASNSVIGRFAEGSIICVYNNGWQ